LVFGSRGSVTADSEDFGILQVLQNGDETGLFVYIYITFIHVNPVGNFRLLENLLYLFLIL
jgi:hypothetical protein